MKKRLKDKLRRKNDAEEQTGAAAAEPLLRDQAREPQQLKAIRRHFREKPAEMPEIQKLLTEEFSE